MGLTLEEANRIIRGALAKAEQLNIKVSAAVCDSGGRLIALQRMDNAIWASAYGSQGKAVASAAFGRPSGEMSERADQPTPRGIAAAEGGHMIMGQEQFRLCATVSSRAPAVLGAVPRSRMKTAPGPVSNNCRKKDARLPRAHGRLDEAARFGGG
jgi:glc operon protein GlcG